MAQPDAGDVHVAGAAAPRRVILVQNFFEELRRLTAADSGR